jgi:sucrose phosphorylase
MLNQVQLITYPDSLGGSLETLNKVLDTHFKDLFTGGVHILPPFPSSGDRGFAPLTYLEINPSFGTWDHIQAIAKNHSIMLDLMVNHISQKSTFFQDYLEKGENSEYADLFLTIDKIWNDGQPRKEDIDKIFLRRKLPYSSFYLPNQSKVVGVWTTFGKEDPSEQIDFDIKSKKTKELLRTFLKNFSQQKVKAVRLDAVGYVIKKMGTSCFFVEPEIYEFLDWVKEVADKEGLELLPEVHAHYSIQYRLADHGFWIYDFILPYLILEALINKQATRLTHYLKTRPIKQFTMLDCHDGIPVKPDLDEIVPSIDAKKTVYKCLERGANLSLVYSDKHKSEDGFDVHQIRCSYYSALNHDDDAYIAARAIQFFTPGIPQVYYMGLLAGANDIEAVQRTGEGREINRHNYSLEEIEASLTKPVVQRLLWLINFRNTYKAFQGVCTIRSSATDRIIIDWALEEYSCTLEILLNNYKSIIRYSTDSEQIIKNI